MESATEQTVRKLVPVNTTTTMEKKIKVSVFVSHRHDDKYVATSMAEKLEILGAGLLEFSYSEQMPVGANWRAWITGHLDSADLMFFIYTSSAQNWDWCLYEAGRYDAKTTEKRILAFIGEQDQPPPPLEHLQAIRVTTEEIKRFLKEFFGSNTYTRLDRPLNEPFAKQNRQVEQLANEICELFSQRKPLKAPYTKYLTIRFADWNALSHDSSLDEGHVETDPRSLDDLFKLTPKSADQAPWTWKDIKRQSTLAEDDAWTEELEQAVHQATSDVAPDPLQASFKAPRSETIYKPVLHRRELHPDGSATFHVLFVEQVTRGIVKGPPDLATLLNSLILGNRLQWEVYERYRHKIDRWADAGLHDGCSQILEAIDNVEREARFREWTETEPSDVLGDRLLWTFPENSRKQISDNLADQTKLKQQLHNALIAVNQGELLRLLPKLQFLNNTLTAAVAQRYHELLKEKTQCAEDS